MKIINDSGEVIAKTERMKADEKPSGLYGLVEIKRPERKGGFFVAMAEGFDWLSKLDLTGEQSKVMLQLFSKLDFENYIQVSQAEIAERIGMKKTHVSRAIKALIDKDIIRKGPKVGTSWTYILNPKIAYKGDVKSERRVKANWKAEAKKKGITVIDGKKEGE